MWKHFLIAVFVAILFSGSFVAAKYVTYDLGPFTTSFLRYFVALLFLAAVVFFRKQNPFKIEKADYWKFALLSLTGIVGYHFFFYTSLSFTSVSNTGVINATSPVFTSLLAMIVLKEKLTAKNYLGVLLSFIGVIILLSKGDIQTILSFNYAFGDLLMYCAVLCWVVYSVVIKSLSKNYSSLTLTFISSLLGVVALLHLSFTEDLAAGLSGMSQLSVFSILYMGIFASGLGYLLYNYCIKNIGPTKTSTIVFSTLPVTVTFLSAIFFGEAVTTTLLISIVLIVIGLNLILIKPESQQEKQAPIHENH